MSIGERATLLALLDALHIAPDRRVALLRVARRDAPGADYAIALRRVAEAPPGCVLAVARALWLETVSAGAVTQESRVTAPGVIH